MPLKVLIGMAVFKAILLKAAMVALFNEYKII
jgi:hypothetical protein